MIIFDDDQSVRVPLPYFLRPNVRQKSSNDGDDDGAVTLAPMEEDRQQNLSIFYRGRLDYNAFDIGRLELMS